MMSIEFLVVHLFISWTLFSFPGLEDLPNNALFSIYVVSLVEEILGVVRLVRRSNRNYLDLT